MRIGELASRADVNIETLRYYERRGLLKAPGRRPSGYREYPPDTVKIVRFIKRAQKLGFTLEEIEDLMALRESHALSRDELRTHAAAKLSDIDRKIAQLQAIRAALGTLLDACHCSDGDLACPILEALDDGADAPADREDDER